MHSSTVMHFTSISSLTAIIRKLTSILQKLLLLSGLQPLWVLACPTIVEYSQQEGFYRVPLPAARQTPNLEDQWLGRSNSRHQVSTRLKRSERTPAAEGGTMGEKLPRILPKVETSTSRLGSFTCRKFTTWDRRLYFPSEERRAEDFFARKIQRFRPGKKFQCVINYNI